MIPVWLFLVTTLSLIGGLGVVVLQRDRARQQVADLLAGACSCRGTAPRCPLHPFPGAPSRWRQAWRAVDK